MRFESRTINNNFMVDHSNERANGKRKKEKNCYENEKNNTDIHSLLYVIKTFRTVFFWAENEILPHRSRMISHRHSFSHILLLLFSGRSEHIYFLIRLNGIRLKQQTGEGKNIN